MAFYRLSACAVFVINLIVKAMQLFMADNNCLFLDPQTRQITYIDETNWIIIVHKYGHVVLTLLSA